MTGQETPDGATPAELSSLPDHLAGALREFRTGRSDSTGDPELEALRAAILLEEIGDVVLTDDQIDPHLLADEASMAQILQALRGER